MRPYLGSFSSDQGACDPAGPIKRSKGGRATCLALVSTGLGCWTDDSRVGGVAEPGRAAAMVMALAYAASRMRSDSSRSVTARAACSEPTSTENSGAGRRPSLGRQVTGSPLVGGTAKRSEKAARQLVEAYLERIEAYDQRGPTINALIMIDSGQWGQDFNTLQQRLNRKSVTAKLMAENGLFGIMLPEEDGGQATTGEDSGGEPDLGPTIDPIG